MSDNIVPLFGDPHRDTQMLLPWYASGRLDEADRALVEAHLETCEECRAELKLERRLAAELASIPLEALPGIKATPARASRPRWRSTAPWIGWAAAAALAIVVLKPWPAPQAPTYHTLSSAPPPGDLVVIFRPDTTEAAMRGILRASNARLVGGPTDADAYVLQAPRVQLRGVIANLRTRHEVLVAEPVGQAQ